MISKDFISQHITDSMRSKLKKQVMWYCVKLDAVSHISLLVERYGDLFLDHVGCSVSFTRCHVEEDSRASHLDYIQTNHG